MSSDADAPVRRPVVAPPDEIKQSVISDHENKNESDKNNEKEKHDIDVERILDEAGDAIDDAIKSVIANVRLIRETRKKLEDNAFARALIVYVAGPLPECVKEVSLHYDPDDRTTLLVFNKSVRCWWVGQLVVPEDATPAQVEYARRFLGFKHRYKTAWRRIIDQCFDFPYVNTDMTLMNSLCEQFLLQNLQH